MGHDNLQNCILNNAHERVYNEDAPVEELPLGLYLVRGDNLCLIAEYDADALDNSVRVSEPLPSIQQQQF